MKVNTVDEVKGLVKGAAKGGDTMTVTDTDMFRGTVIDNLIYNAVFGPTPEVRGKARWIIKSSAINMGIWPASIQGLYDAMGRGEVSGYTVPAVNIRGMSYDVARALVRAAMKNGAGAFIFEIAKSEIGYTYQRPNEFAVVMIAACIKEGFKGPVFIQGDHFQVNAKKHKEDPEKEVESLKELITEAVNAGFYNIDIDTSTLVDLDKPNLDEEQRLNYEVGAELTAHVRQHEPNGVTVSVGGEIGEVGEKNSTVEELVAYMEGYNHTLSGKGDLVGISKVSVQTGTSHGGVPLADGSIAEVAIDFDTLDKLSHTAREKYGMSGAVQHGASTLPDEMFHHFPETTTSEIHLATGFQNMFYDSSHLPAELKAKIYKGLTENFGSERKEGQTEEQFIYKTRKKGFGLVKEEIWTLPEEIRDSIASELEAKFDFLFNKLKAVNTVADVEKYVTHRKVEPDLEAETAMA